MIQTSGDMPIVDASQVPDANTFWESIKALGFDGAVSTITNSLINFGLRLMLAILVFYIGRFLISRIFKTIFKILTKRKVDASLSTFVLSLIKITLFFFLIIIVIGILGVETSSFIAIFASAGMAVGMALSGTLQNFAGGVLILLLKPYKVGDYIEVQGYSGTVKSIQLFNTVINTVDNKAIILPNGVLSTSSINNYSLESYRRVDWSLSLAYGTNLEDAKKAIMEIVNSDERIVKKYIEDDIEYREHVAEQKFQEEHPETLDETKSGLFKRMVHHPKKKIIKATTEASLDMHVAIPVKQDRSPFVGLDQMGDNAIVFVVKVWTHASNYWPLYYNLNERFYTELQEKGFSFPFPQLDVHFDNQAQ